MPVKSKTEKGAERPLTQILRPQTVDELILSPEIQSALATLLEPENLPKFPHLILSGRPGLGKTSTAKVLVTHLLGKVTPYNYRVLNASDERGIDTVRQNIKEFMMTNSMHRLTLNPSARVSFKILFLDEADALTDTAQDALRVLMQSYHETTRVILCCNRPEKLKDTLHSRCIALNYVEVDEERVFNQLKRIIYRRELHISEEVLRRAVSKSRGDIRAAVKYLLGIVPTQEVVEPIYFLSEEFQLVDLKRHENMINNNYRGLIAGFCEILQKRKPTSALYDVICNLAVSEAAIAYGALPFVQISGFLSYYHRLAPENGYFR